jgi:hypothetical protein
MGRALLVVILATAVGVPLLALALCLLGGPALIPQAAVEGQGRGAEFAPNAIVSIDPVISLTVVRLANRHAAAGERGPWAATAADEPPLYGPLGIKPQAVRQGSIGSCYFHATVAAIAQASPQLIENMLRPNSAGGYTVEFKDGKKETAYLEDVLFARKSGFEQSDGLWVGVLFRAYAQRVLRQALIGAIDKSSLFPLLKKYAADFISSNDAVLLAYDHAIRAVVGQRGEMDRGRLIAELRSELKPLNLSEAAQEAVLGVLDSAGVFDALVAMVQQNGELFGAYRAVGNGGLPLRVIRALVGDTVRGLWLNKDRREALSFMERADRLPVVASSGAEYGRLLAAGQRSAADGDWYVASHAFTVLAYDAVGLRVTLRNPWGHHPAPDGVFTLSLERFLEAFEYVTAAGPAPASPRPLPAGRRPASAGRMTTRIGAWRAGLAQT